MKNLDAIQDWKEFERLCADLLEAEGFHIDSEPKVDRTGADIEAICEYRSHGIGIPPIRVRWRVQCKHLAGSGNQLGRNDVERALVSFDAIRGPDDGLLLMISSDYTEPAREVVSRFVESRPGAKVMMWNHRQLLALLDRHGHLLRRYGLEAPQTSAVRPALSMRGLEIGPVLFVSDQSALAHDLAAQLRAAGLDVVFLPHWNYVESERLALFMKTFAKTHFGLCVCFMGDSFGLPFPLPLEIFIGQAARRGTPLLLFPFVAWSVDQGALGSVATFVPVRLNLDRAPKQVFSRTTLFGERRRDDYRWLLVEGSFEEDEYREYDPADGQELLTDGLSRRFGLSHSFEHLRVVDGSKVLWRDRSGNPFVVVADFDGTKVAYVNSCCHSCMTAVPIPSPLSVSGEFGVLIGNLIRWLADKNTPLPNSPVSARRPA